MKSALALAALILAPLFLVTPLHATETSDTAPAETARDNKADVDAAPAETATDEKASNEKADSETVTDDKAAGEAATNETATDEKAASKTAVEDKANGESATAETAAVGKAAEDKAAEDKAAEDKAAEDKAASETQPNAKQADKPKSLTIASWGGAYAKSQEIAFIQPFESETGIEIKLVSHRGAFGRLKRNKGSKPPKWDVVDLGAGALETACRDGLLEKFDTSDLAAAGDEKPEKDDFLPGALHDCGVASVAWSSAIVYDRKAFKKSPPKTAKDFFDAERFPGKRALPKDPKYVLPLALMADGIEPDLVYRELDTNGGVKRALAKLENIRDQIIWWDKPHQPLKMLSDGTAPLATAFNGRAFYAIARDNKKLGLVWDGQIYDLDMWAVPKGTPNRDAAFAFIAFSIKPERLAEQTRWFPYGPMRKSAIAKIGKHAEVNVEMRDFVPTAGDNFKRALQIDSTWWEANAERVTLQFEAWLAKPLTDSSADAEAENTKTETKKK